jgi:hypothetical protein
MSSIITRRAFPEDLGAIGWAFATFDDDGVSATDRGATNPTANVSATSTAVPGMAPTNLERSLFFSPFVNISFLLFANHRDLIEWYGCSRMPLDGLDLCRAGPGH